MEQIHGIGSSRKIEVGDVIIDPFFKYDVVKEGGEMGHENLLLGNTEKFDSIVCSDEISYPTDCIESGVNNNILVIGGSGTGKTRCVVEPNLQAMEHSNCIVTLTKPRLIAKYKKLFEAKGYQTGILDISNPKMSTVRWDPIAFCRSWKDVSKICEAIVYANPKKHSANSSTDPYWDSASKSLLEGLFAGELQTEERPSTADVIDMFRNLEITESSDLIETNMDSFFNVIRQANWINGGSDYCYSRWQTFRNCPLKTAASILTSLGSILCEVFSEEMLGVFKSNLPLLDFGRFDISRRKYILFINTSPINEGENFLANILYSQAFAELFRIAIGKESGKLDTPCVLICDDAALSPIKELPEYSSIIRETGVSIMMNFQSESQISALYGSGAADTIINNCDTIIYLGGQDLQSCKNISSRINLPVSEVMWLPIGQEYIFRRGEKGPIITKRHEICE